MARHSVTGIFERIITPFHNMSVVLTGVSALSIHALLTQLFEPLTYTYQTFLLTFPLTAGLLIVFLIAYNTNWKTISFFYVILSVMPVALLFMLLTIISEKYGLEKNAKHEQEHKTTALIFPKKDSLAAVPVIRKSIIDADPVAMQKSLDEMLRADSIARYRQAHPAWYQKIALTRNLVAATAYLKESFITMYNNYGARRFITGIVLALLLAWYIQTRGINKILTAPNKVDNDGLI